MKPTTRYRYEKRIEELERKLSRLEAQHDIYRDICSKVYDWLAPFGETGKGSPNAGFGLGLFKQLIWRSKE